MVFLPFLGIYAAPVKVIQQKTQNGPKLVEYTESRCAVYFTHLKSRLRDWRWRLACLAPSWRINKCKLTEESARRYLTHITQSSQRERKFTLICGCTWALSLPTCLGDAAQATPRLLSGRLGHSSDDEWRVSTLRPTSAMGDEARFAQWKQEHLTRKLVLPVALQVICIALRTNLKRNISFEWASCNANLAQAKAVSECLLSRSGLCRNISLCC